MNQALKPNGTLCLPFGAFDLNLTGGPYEYSPVLGTGMLRVKLAREIPMSCDVNLPIHDFSVPGEAEAVDAIKQVLLAASNGQPVYAGCMAGRGRTGLFFALLTKLSQDYAASCNVIPVGVKGNFDPVKYVREHYYAHAVETQGQYDYVRDFRTDELIHFVHGLQPVVGSGLAAALSRFAEALVGFGRAILGAVTGRRATGG